ncbi:four helix bundle protein [Runella sp.]|uniref:four helix bundle protein n=1 Tax=Runella sp. TaxID=1960881 RepID=UPI003D0C6A8A
MQKSKGFRDLIVWQKAHQLVLEVYTLTEAFPKEEFFVLTSQIRRSTISIAANIVEGYRKRTKPDEVKYMNIAQGSLDETFYYFILAQDLGYANTAELQEKIEEIAKMLHAYSASIQNS